jgi:hypothetical protein
MKIVRIGLASALSAVVLVGSSGCAKGPSVTTSECALSRRLVDARARFEAGQPGEITIQDSNGLIVYQFEGFDKLNVDHPDPEKSKYLLNGLVVVRGRALAVAYNARTYFSDLETFGSLVCARGAVLNEGLEVDKFEIDTAKIRENPTDTLEDPLDPTITIGFRGATKGLPDVNWNLVCLEGPRRSTVGQSVPALKVCPLRVLYPKDSDDTLVNALSSEG